MSNGVTRPAFVLTLVLATWSLSVSPSLAALPQDSSPPASSAQKTDSTKANGQFPTKDDFPLPLLLREMLGAGATPDNPQEASRTLILPSDAVGVKKEGVDSALPRFWVAVSCTHFHVKEAKRLMVRGVETEVYVEATLVDALLACRETFTVRKKDWVPRELYRQAGRADPVAGLQFGSGKTVRSALKEVIGKVNERLARTEWLVKVLKAEESGVILSGDGSVTVGQRLILKRNPRPASEEGKSVTPSAAPLTVLATVEVTQVGARTIRARYVEPPTGAEVRPGDLAARTP